MMLDAFGVHFGGPLGYAEGHKEVDHFLMTSATAIGQGLALGGEKHGAIGFVVDEVFLAKTSDGLGHSDMRNAEPLSHINGAGLSAFPDEVGDQFDVILFRLGGVVTAGRAEGGGTKGLTLQDGLRRWRFAILFLLGSCYVRHVRRVSSSPAWSSQLVLTTCIIIGAMWPRAQSGRVL